MWPDPPGPRLLRQKQTDTTDLNRSCERCTFSLPCTFSILPKIHVHSHVGALISVYEPIRAKESEDNLKKLLFHSCIHRNLTVRGQNPGHRNALWIDRKSTRLNSSHA